MTTTTDPPGDENVWLVSLKLALTQRDVSKKTMAATKDALALLPPDKRRLVEARLLTRDVYGVGRTQETAIEDALGSLTMRQRRELEAKLKTDRSIVSAGTRYLR